MIPSEAPTLGAFVLLALTGAPHCAGMCGGLAIAADRVRGEQRQPWLDRTAFLVGKAATYALLGVTLALGVTRIMPEGALATARSGLAWAAGGALVLGGLISLGILRPFARLSPGWVRHASHWLGGARRAVGNWPGATAPLGAGLLTGLLPCGLSWSAFLLAAASPPAIAALGLMLFGLATGPALIGTILVSRGVTGPLRRHARAVAGVALVLLGAYTAWRGGIPGMSPDMGGSGPPCCAESTAPQ